MFGSAASSVRTSKSAIVSTRTASARLTRFARSRLRHLLGARLARLALLLRRLLRELARLRLPHDDRQDGLKGSEGARVQESPGRSGLPGWRSPDAARRRAAQKRADRAVPDAFGALRHTEGPVRLAVCGVGIDHFRRAL